MVNNTSICWECGKKGEFKFVEIEETSEIKDEFITSLHRYYECPNCGELFAPFDDPDYNIRMDFDSYRIQKGFLNTNEIIEIRKKYSLSQRDFAEILGISYSTISSIENGSLHNQYQDSLFTMSSQPIAFYDLLQKRKNLLSDEKFAKVSEAVEHQIMEEEKIHKVWVAKVDKKISLLHDRQNERIRMLNMIKREQEHLSKKIYSKDIERSTTSGLIKTAFQPLFSK